MEFHLVDSHEMVMVRCRRSTNPVYCHIKGKSEGVFYVRETSRTRALGMAEFLEYARQHFH